VVPSQLVKSNNRRRPIVRERLLPVRWGRLGSNDTEALWGPFKAVKYFSTEIFQILGMEGGGESWARESVAIPLRWNGILDFWSWPCPRKRGKRTSRSENEKRKKEGFKDADKETKILNGK